MAVEQRVEVEHLEQAAGREWLSWSRMADFRDQAPPILVGGEGPYVFEADGTRLFDGVSGLFTTQIGYSHGAELGAAGTPASGTHPRGPPV